MNDEDRDTLRRIADGLTALHGHQRFFGITPRDLIFVVGIFASIVAFYTRTNDAMDRLIRSTEYLADFSKNSDAWHSAATGAQFSQGRPMNSNFDASIYRPENLNGADNSKNGGREYVNRLGQNL